ncbi:hypothetical protein [Aliikangiella coralliicola]|uniref:Uncharacterized protein n=1 Tax=Aliikangiella coralliicola TaxID=2592383 RepID=A0A545UAP5_9GAMM|nr:hypothetical protein [Aliikangiella coralliicola]TQV86529.1 hypothetical protein FLL46_16610 [Aliikangiella coralliicola]
MNFKYLAIAAVSLLSLNVAAKEESHHHNFTKEVAAFHDVLAPLWHSPDGKQKQTDTCAKVAKLKKLATDIPQSEQLTKNLTALAETCNQDQKLFDKAFHHVHLAFHNISDAKKAHKKHKE